VRRRKSNGRKATTHLRLVVLSSFSVGIVGVGSLEIGLVLSSLLWGDFGSVSSAASLVLSLLETFDTIFFFHSSKLLVAFLYFNCFLGGLIWLDFGCLGLVGAESFLPGLLGGCLEASALVEKFRSFCFVRFDHVAKCLDQVSVGGYAVILVGQTFQLSSVRLGKGCYLGTGSQSRSVGRGGQDSGDGGSKFHCVWLLSSLFVSYCLFLPSFFFCLPSFFAFLLFFLPSFLSGQTTKLIFFS
jgi:hypothetical protein